MRSVLAVVAAGCLLAQVMPAQPPPATQREAPQQFRAGIDLVQVDVSVLDKQRQPVRGLTAGDFRLLEDGKPRPIVAFTAVDLPERPAGVTAPWVRDVPSDVSTNIIPQEGRLVVILMDRTIPNGFPTLNARNIARAAVRELGPSDLAAVVYTGDGTPHDLTNDRARLLATIDGSYPAAELSSEANAVWGSLLGDLENPEATKSTALAALDSSAECLCGVCVLEAITRIADAVRDVGRRRKSLLFIGADIQIETKALTCVDRVSAAREVMFKALDLSSLTVHSLDPMGLETLASSPSSRAFSYQGQPNLVRQGNIAVLPDRTGGRTVINTNKPEARVPEIFTESDSYYLLGFEPAVADGRRHEIDVKVNRRAVDVRTRREYVASPPTARAAGTTDAGSDARRVIEGVMPTRDGVSLSASVVTAAAANTREPILAVALHVQHDAARAAPTATSIPEQVEVVTAVFSMTGRRMGTLSQTLRVTPQASVGGTIAYDVLQRIPAKPGRYELRIGLHNAARRQTGSVYTFVDVPDYAKTSFALGDLAMYTAGGIPAMSDSLADLLLAPPTARRDFDRRERVTAFLRVYEGAAGSLVPVALSVRLLDERNRRRYGQDASIPASDFTANRTADYVVDLPLGDLERGSYLLTIEAKAGTSSARRDAKFAVK